MKHPYLRNCRYDKALKLSNKKFVHNYYELAAEINLMEDSEFRQHVTKNYDDFAAWIIDNQDDNALVNKLKGVKSKKRYAAIIEKRIRKLEKVTTTHKGISSAWIIAVILAMLIIIQYSYFTYQRYEDEEARHVLMKEISQGATQQEIDNQIIKELESEKAALAEKINLLENENIKLISKPFVRGPQDWVADQQIRISGKNLNIYVDQGPVVASIAGTGSMLPILTKTSNAIEIIPKKVSDIAIGDIIAYKLNDEYIIHRVIDLGEDEQGWYAITKGDNSLKEDTEKVRFEQVERVVVGIIY